MKSLSLVLLSFLISISFPNNNISAENPDEKNRIEIAILLDTSGSMEGLIEQAKSQLWKIVNELATAKKGGKSSELFVSLYEYGKDDIPVTEGHIRMLVPLTQDLDKISEELFKLRTNGGNEYCGMVIRDAVNGLKWSSNNDDLKMIFIAGNEPFTQGEVDYKISCGSAIKNGIIVNTIFCGNYNEGIQTNWKDGADLADGEYMNIDHNQEIAYIKAPQDDELIKLGQQLNTTYLAYGEGGAEFKMRQEEQDKNSMSVNEEVMVQRSVTKAGDQYNNAGWDLIDAEKTGKVKVEDLKESELPEEMKTMTVNERKEYLAGKEKEREQIQNKINKLNEERRKYVAQKILENQDNTLDAVLIKTIREQAEQQNYKFE